VMVDNSGYHKVFCAENKRVTNGNKCMIDLAHVIGKPFETVFSVVDRQTGKLEEITEPQSNITEEYFTGLDLDDDPEDSDAPEDAQMAPAAGLIEETKDNRNMNDNNKAQSLKMTDVMLMKDSNVGG